MISPWILGNHLSEIFHQFWFLFVHIGFQYKKKQIKIWEKQTDPNLILRKNNKPNQNFDTNKQTQIKFWEKDKTTKQMKHWENQTKPKSNNWEIQTNPYQNLAKNNKLKSKFEKTKQTQFKNWQKQQTKIEIRENQTNLDQKLRKNKQPTKIELKKNQENCYL